MNNMPNFLIVGAHKAGTTSLYQYLKQHPQIFMSSIKEPHFFSFMGQSLNFNDPGFNPTKLQSVSSKKDYQALFQNVGDAIAIGEASPSYLYVAQSASTICQHLPRVKIIVILRNPVDRAYSNFLHCRKRKQKDPLDDFSEALAAESIRIQDNWSPLWHYQQKGFYYQQLQRYYEQFPKEQIRIYLYDDLLSSPKEMFQDIFRFLQVDATFVPDMSKRHNVSGVPQNKVWQVILSRLRWLKPMLPKIVGQHLKELALTRPPYPLAARKRLIALYREDVLHLQELIQRDLTHWLKIE